MQARTVLEAIYRSAITAAQPALLLRRHLKIARGELLVKSRHAQHRFPLRGRVYVVGAGKGVDLTGPVWEDLLAERLGGGVLLVRDRTLEKPLRRISIHVGNHPIPDRQSLRGTERCLELLRRARREDLVLFFLMGGASSLLVRPAANLTLEDKQAVTKGLLRSGMTIGEMNCVRKHLSEIKAGGVLRAAYPARVISFAISDVVGDDPSVIGSAPTFYDPTTFRDAWNALRKHRLLQEIPPKVKQHLLQGIRGGIPETLKPDNPLCRGNPYILLANNRDSLLAARDTAEAFGFATTVVTTELQGDTRMRARETSALLKRISQGTKPYRRSRCLLIGGETTVQVRGTGLGGRNLEFALVSAMELTGHCNVYLLSAGSDGSDGPTDAAGAYADGKTIAKACSLGMDPDRALKNNDSYHFFRCLGDLFSPGPTGTNVLDLKIILLY